MEGHLSVRVCVHVVSTTQRSIAGMGEEKPKGERKMPVCSLQHRHRLRCCRTFRGIRGRFPSLSCASRRQLSASLHHISMASTGKAGTSWRAIGSFLSSFSRYASGNNVPTRFPPHPSHTCIQTYITMRADAQSRRSHLFVLSPASVSQVLLFSLFSLLFRFLSVCARPDPSSSSAGSPTPHLPPAPRSLYHYLSFLRSDPTRLLSTNHV